MARSRIVEALDNVRFMSAKGQERTQEPELRSERTHHRIVHRPKKCGEYDRPRVAKAELIASHHHLMRRDQSVSHLFACFRFESAPAQTAGSPTIDCSVGARRRLQRPISTASRPGNELFP